MIAWLKRLFTPSQAPPRPPHEYGYTSVKTTRIVTLNGKKLDGDDADRVSKILDEGFGDMDKAMDRMHRMADELHTEAERQAKKE